MIALGMNGWGYLRTTDPVARRLMISVYNQAIRARQQLDQQLGIAIANNVIKSLTGK